LQNTFDIKDIRQQLKIEIMKKLMILTVIILVSLSAAFGQTKAGKINTTPHPTFYSLPRKSSASFSLSSKEILKAQVAKVTINPVHMVSRNLGGCPFCSFIPGLSLKERMKAEVVRLSSCSMRSDRADAAYSDTGKCPRCGMALSTK
jgi:hypothetical protein